MAFNAKDTDLLPIIEVQLLQEPRFMGIALKTWATNMFHQNLGFPPDIILVDGSLSTLVEVAKDFVEVFTKMPNEDLLDFVHEPFLIRIVNESIVINSDDGQEIK